MISIIIPTKNRINNLKEVFKSLNETTLYSKEVEVVLYVDYDDDPTVDFLKNEINDYIGIIKTSAIIGKT